LKAKSTPRKTVDELLKVTYRSSVGTKRDDFGGWRPQRAHEAQSGA